MKDKLLKVGYTYFQNIPCSRFGIVGNIKHKITVVAYIQTPNGPQEILEVEEIFEETKEKSVVLYDQMFQDRPLI